MKGSLLLVVVPVLCSCALFGQALPSTDLPQAPSVSTAETSRQLLAISVDPAQSVFPANSSSAPRLVLKTVTPKERKPEPKVFDKKMIFLMALSSAATFADLEMTSRCLRTQTCTEANPLFGQNPSRARMYGISLPLLGGQFAISAWLKHRNPKSKAWMMPMVSGTAAHSVGAITAIGK